MNENQNDIVASDSNGVEIENEEFQPFDPEKISIDTKPITMDTCLRRLEQGTIVLNPDFQRNEVWTEEKKCRLIESLMLKIPLPMFYVSADESGVFKVVDGLQRLSTIRSYVLGDEYFKTKNPEFKGKGFKLQNLEFWGDKFNKLSFNDLPTLIRNRILETQFTFTIINPGTPEEVKRNIFKRINTGGEPLTSQEIRHALYIGASTNLLQILSEREEFLVATDYSVKSARMMDKELILRFLAFTVRSHKAYPKNNDMDRFLSDTMRILNVFSDLNSKEALRIFNEKTGILKSDLLIQDVDQLGAIFVDAMTRAFKLFGEHTFRKSFGVNRRTPINKSLFEVWSSLLGRLTDDEFQILYRNRKKFLVDYYVILADPDLDYVISRDSLKWQSVDERYAKMSDLLKTYTHD